MITERNMIFANPQAYRVFPNIGNPMNTGITEQAVYQGYLQVTDSTGKTQSFTGTSTIDFTGFSGYVDIDQYSDVGSVKLGRWNIISNTPVEPILPGQKTFAESTAADYVLYDKVNDKKICVEYGTDLSNYSSEQYTPIGIVVVPGTHDVYGDGSCGVMSLKGMDCNNPSQGAASNEYMYWGVYGTDISSLPNLNQAPIVGSGSNVGNASSTVTGQDSYPYLPSDKFSAVLCPHDTDAYYYSSSSSYDQAPSPYLTDGSRNPAYYQTTSPSSSNNCLADFDGRGNTNKIIIQRGSKDYSSWRPGTSSESDYPAASCCDIFYTDGTQQGDWYLPAMCELGYIMPPFNKINEAITKMRNAYGTSVGVEVNTGGWYWSSSEYNSSHARYLSTINGIVYNNYKYNDYYVRAFLRVADDTQEQPIEEYEYVDLGLPSGLLWAKKNIGAETEEDAGLYFQWGDTVGYTAEQVGTGEGKKTFDATDYKYINIDGTTLTITKYNSEDNKISLDVSDDAARTILGDTWRIPTKEEYEELIANTDIIMQQKVQEVRFNSELTYLSEQTVTEDDYKLLNFKFCKKTDHSVFIIFKLNGVAVYGEIESGNYDNADGVSIICSTSSMNPTEVDTEDNPYVYCTVFRLEFKTSKIYMSNKGNRLFGYNIRAVKSNN